MPTNRTIMAAAVVALAVTLGACASAPDIRVDGDPSADLSSYKTFGFFERLSIDRPTYSTIVAQRLKDVTRRELQRRGYQEAQSNPELLVNFNTNVQSRTEVNSTGGFYSYRSGMYSAWSSYPQDIYTTHYQEGTLAIDLVDAAKQQLVWQGIAQARLTRAMLDNPSATIDTVVTDIFARYPLQPVTPVQ